MTLQTLQIDLYDDSPTGKGGKNWVTKAGGLPGPIRARYRALRRKHPEWSREHCYAVAVNAVKYSAATGDSKLPGKQNQRKSKVAAHTAAAAKWQRMKAKSGGKKNLSYDEVIEEINLATTTDTKKTKGKKELETKLNVKINDSGKKKTDSSGKQTEGKEGAASDSNRSPEALKKTIKAYMKNKKKMSSEQRKKVEARIKSSKQQLGQKGKM